MRGYRSELPSLRRRVAQLERELAELEWQLGLGESARNEIARAGYRAGRWLARQLRRLRRRGARGEEQVLQRLRARESKLLEEIALLTSAAAVADEPLAAPEPPSAPAPADPTPLQTRLAERGFRLGRHVSRWFRRR